MTPHPTSPGALWATEDHDPRIVAFQQEFPDWRVFIGHDACWAVRLGVYDGLAGVSAPTLDELWQRLVEALETCP
ncbi:hypothetical protein [Nocardiopsis sp. LOL_012]|uniref:hypothetical protein n=1 Tax=Nocardiopsis sp. LOL_012 TaxID=3345409 RepID=UPI003A8C817C